ncbi:hypothetical protein QCA50_013798 [Cerrena zonata]|uniref:Transmembrane protein n=1 Tax=Cerrena zonata TaxID=2478898 RepID=A0AAW0G247_9APHY
MSSPVASSSLRTVFGTWSSNSTSEQVDLEAQTISGTRLPFTPAITPLAPAAPRTSRDSMGTDPIDDFFGVSRTHGTSDSRHDTPALPSMVEQDVEAPPPYAYGSDLPSYTAVAEPPTLAMYLFKFGFLFPLFWIAGIVILISPLSAPENWEPTKTEAERQELIELLRRTERKWAKRCLVAFSILAIIAIAITLTAVMVMRS